MWYSQAGLQLLILMPQPPVSCPCWNCQYEPLCSANTQFLFVYFETGSHYISQGGLEPHMSSRLASNHGPPASVSRMLRLLVCVTWLSQITSYLSEMGSFNFSLKEDLT